MKSRTGKRKYTLDRLKTEKYVYKQEKKRNEAIEERYPDQIEQIHCPFFLPNQLWDVIKQEWWIQIISKPIEMKSKYYFYKLRSIDFAIIKTPPPWHEEE